MKANLSKKHVFRNVSLGEVTSIKNSGHYGQQRQETRREPRVESLGQVNFRGGVSGKQSQVFTSRSNYINSGSITSSSNAVNGC